MNDELKYILTKPNKALSAFVDSFWMLHNPSDTEKEVVIVPDGRIDLFFSQSPTRPFYITLFGLETQPEQTKIPPKQLTYAISFKPLVTEYLFENNIANLLDNAENLPTDFWDFTAEDLNNFDHFCRKATQKIQSLLPNEIDDRKQKLFDLIYLSNAELTVKELAEKAYWSRQQINRYFSQQFGLSVKAYCNIIRFRASLRHIKEGKLFPQQNFADQSHFIKEVKKHSGVSPKELLKNQNERFIQFSNLTIK